MRIEDSGLEGRRHSGCMPARKPMLSLDAVLLDVGYLRYQVQSLTDGEMEQAVQQVVTSGRPPVCGSHRSAMYFIAKNRLSASQKIEIS